MPIKIGLIGKTNTGKTTFFNAATLAGGEISTYPFTTKKAQKATGNAITPCVDTELLIAITDVFRGIGVKEGHVKETLKVTGLEDKHFDNFDMHDSKKFAAHLRKISKPTLIVANKIDLPGADKNFDRLREKYVDK